MGLRSTNKGDRRLRAELLVVALASVGLYSFPPAQPPALALAFAIAAPLVASGTASASAAPAPAEPPKPAGPCPAEMAHIGRSCVDRYEAHLVITKDGAESRHSWVTRPPSRTRYEARSKKGVFPQAYISRIEAAKACDNAGKRLCNWIEWRRACQGSKWRRYPYGNRMKKGHCNVGKLHLMQELFGADPTKWGAAEFNSPALNEQPGFLAKTGKHAECVSEDGVYDMVGNVHEWISGNVTKAFMKKIEAEDVKRLSQPWRVGNAIFLGGFYSTLNGHGPGCHFTTVAHEDRYHDYSTGFRCCADAKLR